MEVSQIMVTDNFYQESKTFYRPIDAAIRWCGLIQFEAQILDVYSSHPDKLAKLFPQWPCLQINIEKIQDAVRNNELSYGYFGITVSNGTAIDNIQFTVRHSDLRLWMSIRYPEHKPRFLFGAGGDSHTKINTGTYLSLQADREALKVELKKYQDLYQDVLSDLRALGLERKELNDLIKSHSGLSGRSELTYRQIIGALLHLFLSRSPAGKPLSVFESQAAIVDALTVRYKDIPGLSKRTLDEKFAAANRSIQKLK